MSDKPTNEDSLLLCASDLQHSAIYDNHSEMQSCIRAVADRITALVSVIDSVERTALDALKHPAVKPDMLVNGGALKLALNVLRRAGKNEVADELECTAQAAPSNGALAAPAQVPAQDDSLTAAPQVTGAHCARYCEAQAFLITMRNLHAEIERLRTCNKDAQHEIANLQAAQAQPVKTGSTFHGEIMSTKQPEALRLAEWLEGIRGRTWPSCTPQEAAAELRRLQSENEQLRAELAASRLEIASLQAQPDDQQARGTDAS